MRVLRFSWDNQAKWGKMKDGFVEELRWKDSHLLTYELTGAAYHADEVKLLPPCIPSKIIGVGLNYRSHAEELGLPLPQAPILFFKPSTAVIGPGSPVVLPTQSKRVDYEAELGVVIGREAKNVPVQRAKEFVWGYTCANDITARDLQPKDGQWTLSKGFDTFAPIGPWIETEIEHPSELVVAGLLNGKEVQRGSVDDLVFRIDELIAYISSCMTLLPGDVIFTGTPSGIGSLKENDFFTVSIEGIGELTNRALARE